MIEKVDFSETEICTDIYIGDEAMEILGRFFSGISPDLPLLVNSGKVINIYETKVQKMDCLYHCIFRDNILGTDCP